MTDADLTLDHQLCFALYAATHAITRFYRPMLGEIGLTYPQYLVLLALLRTEPQTVQGLARALKLDAGTLTPLLKRLAAAGLVSRERSAEDERVVHVSLTANGRALRHELARIRQEVACRTGLAAAEMAALRATLHELVDALQTPGREPALAE